MLVVHKRINFNARCAQLKTTCVCTTTRKTLKTKRQQLCLTGALTFACTYFTTNHILEAFPQNLIRFQQSTDLTLPKTTKVLFWQAVDLSSDPLRVQPPNKWTWVMLPVAMTHPQRAALDGLWVPLWTNGEFNQAIKMVFHSQGTTGKIGSQGGHKLNLLVRERVQMLYWLNADAALTACINKEVGPRDDCAWEQDAMIKGSLRHWNVQKGLLLEFCLQTTALYLPFVFQVPKFNFLNIDFSPVTHLGIDGGWDSNS